MKNILSQIGINSLTSCIYEYEASIINWWDKENPTAIEIQIISYDENAWELSVVFVPETDGIIERTPVFQARFLNGEVHENALVVKPLVDNSSLSDKFTFSEEYNAYLLSTNTEVEKVFSALCDLINNKKPLFVVEIKEEGEQNENTTEELPYAPGETLHHFLAMMSINQLEYTKENIFKELHVSKQEDGVEYIQNLKGDIANNEFYSFLENYNVDKDSFKVITSVISSY